MAFEDCTLFYFIMNEKELNVVRVLLRSSSRACLRNLRQAKPSTIMFRECVFTLNRVV
jgi:hypothetical protein